MNLANTTSCVVRIATVIYLLILVEGFIPEIQMPYKAISGISTTEISTIGPTLTCDEQRRSLQDCATECFDRSLTTTGCPGFYIDTTQSNICHLCHVSYVTEVQDSSYKTFDSNEKLYLLKDKPVVPEVSVNFDNYTGDTIYGENVIGTASGVVASDHVEGRLNQALCLRDGGKVRLTGSGTECWTNLDYCTSGMTASIWYKPIVMKNTYVAGSGVQFQKGFAFYLHNDVGNIILFSVTQEDGRHNIQSESALVVNEWFLLTGSYNDADGATVYINGVFEGLDEEMNPLIRSINEVDWGGHIGIKDAQSYTEFPANGYVDEFKYYYRVLNPVEVWREYIGYDLDQDRPSIIPSSDLVSSGNDYTELVDGNLATCVQLSETSCSAALKVKMWNSASDRTNYTVIIVTENLECDHTSFMVYGGQDLPDGLSGTIPDEKMHFLGNHKIIRLDSQSVVNEQNECVFRPQCGGVYYDIIVSVKNVPDEGSWKICEVLFK